MDVNKRRNSIVDIAKNSTMGTYCSEHENANSWIPDARESAYAACVYVRCQVSNDKVHTTLLIAKTKVAPIKKLTIPKFELCAAELLTKVVKNVVNIIV